MVEHIALTDLASISGDGGVVWSSSPEGVHVNLVVLAAHQAIGRHRNDELDVLIVVLQGDAQVVVDDDSHQVSALNAVLVPRGAERAVAAGSGGARYLTVHRARSGLTISTGTGHHAGDAT